MEHTRWSLVVGEAFPWNLYVTEGERIVLTMQRAAFSTAQKSVDDCMAGVGFPRDQRDYAVAQNARQMEDAAFIVLAVNAHQALVEALEACRAQLTFLLATKPLVNDEFRDIYAEAIIGAQAALKQARGEE